MKEFTVGLLILWIKYKIFMNSFEALWNFDLHIMQKYEFQNDRLRGKMSPKNPLLNLLYCIVICPKIANTNPIPSLVIVCVHRILEYTNQTDWFLHQHSWLCGPDSQPDSQSVSIRRLIHFQGNATIFWTSFKLSLYLYKAI